MKKLLPALLATALAVGPAFADEGTDWCHEWQQTRCPPIPYAATVANPQVAGLVNAASAIPGAIYGFVADGVDKNYAKNEGRKIYLGVRNDVDAGGDEAQILASMSADDRRAYDEYVRLVVNTDYSSIRTRLAEMVQQLATAAAQLTTLLPQAKEQFKATGANALQMVSMLKPVNRDLSAIKAQIADANAGIKYWLDLVDQDEKAQSFMKDAEK